MNEPKLRINAELKTSKKPDEVETLVRDALCSLGYSVQVVAFEINEFA